MLNHIEVDLIYSFVLIREGPLNQDSVFFDRMNALLSRDQLLNKLIFT